MSAIEPPLRLTFNLGMAEFPRAGVSMTVQDVRQLREAIKKHGLDDLERVECECRFEDRKESREWQS